MYRGGNGVDSLQGSELLEGCLGPESAMTCLLFFFLPCPQESRLQPTLQSWLAPPTHSLLLALHLSTVRPPSSCFATRGRPRAYRARSAGRGRGSCGLDQPQPGFMGFGSFPSWPLPGALGLGSGCLSASPSPSADLAMALPARHTSAPTSSRSPLPPMSSHPTASCTLGLWTGLGSPWGAPGILGPGAPPP